MTDDISTISRDGVTVISLNKRYETIEETDIESLQESMEEVVAALESPRVVVDLAATTFFGSSFIEVLFRVWRSLKKRDGRFAIGGLNSYCREVLEVSRLDRLWELHGSIDEAITSLNAS